MHLGLMPIDKSLLLVVVYQFHVGRQTTVLFVIMYVSSCKRPLQQIFITSQILGNLRRKSISCNVDYYCRAILIVAKHLFRTPPTLAEVKTLLS